MSNILIIKHGSLGDLIQANGAIEDISNSFKDSKVFGKRTYNLRPYVEFMSDCLTLMELLWTKDFPGGIYSIYLI